MSGHKRIVVCLLGLCFGITAKSEVRVFVQDAYGVAWIDYECTAGEVVRAFALNVSVDRGQIAGVSEFFRGESQAGATGYGIFPAALRAQLQSGLATNIDWNASDYTPLAVAADAPGDTLPGLNSSGVTLEFGGLWDPTIPEATPGPAGTLCALELSQPANVSVSANISRGGVLSAFAETTIQPVFLGAIVGPFITATTLDDGVITVQFHGGELQTAPSADGPWTDTGDTSGTYAEAVGAEQMKFFRVRSF
jgi:hypothetical protein